MDFPYYGCYEHGFVDDDLLEETILLDTVHLLFNTLLLIFRLLSTCVRGQLVRTTAWHRFCA